MLSLHSNRKLVRLATTTDVLSQLSQVGSINPLNDIIIVCKIII